MPIHFTILTIVILYLLGTLFISYWNLAFRTLAGQLVLVGLPLMLMLLPRMDILLLLGMVFYNSQIYLPGFPAALDLARVFFMLSLMSAFAGMLIRHKQGKKLEPVDLLLLAYTGLLGVHFAVRGFGMRILGSESWGGGDAIALLIHIALFLFRYHFVLTPRKWILAFSLMTAFSAAPVIADMAFIVTKGRIYQLFYFIRHTPGSLMTGLADPTFDEVWRLQRTIFFIPFLLALALWLLKTGRIPRLIFYVLIFLAITLAAISGHRIAAITMLLLAFFFRVVEHPKQLVRTTVRYAAVILIAWLILIPAARLLPPAGQRIVAVLPLVEVDRSAERQAVGTVSWRVEVWKANLQDVPKYFWIGKGLLIHQDEIMAFYAQLKLYRQLGLQANIYELSRWNRDYHNGPLALLLDTGIFGLILASLMMYAICRTAFNDSQMTTWANSDLMWMHKVLTATLLANVFTFWLFYGDTRFMLQLLFFGVILHALKSSDQNLCDEMTPIIAQMNAPSR